MKKIGDFLKEKREAAGLSFRDASRLSGISHTHIRDIERESSAPTFDMILRLLRAYPVELGEFLRETGHLPPDDTAERGADIKRVPVISWTQAGHWREARASEEWEEFIETGGKGTFALKVRGDSMEPEFHEGDILVINPYLKQEHNDYLVVCNEEWEATFKQLKKYGKTRVLHPLNPKYEDIELNKSSEYRVIGVVVEKKKRYK